MKLFLGAAAVSLALSGPVLGQTWTYIDRLIPEDASADGGVVVGSSVGGSARWTAAEGLRIFGTESGFGARNRAEAVTADGSQVFGFSSYPGGGNTDRMYRWTGPGTFQGLGIFGAAERIKVNAASADGTVVVSTASAGQGALYQGCVWTAQGGFRSIPGVGTYSTAVAVTADGTRIAGTRLAPGNESEAYVWSEAQGLAVLTTPNGRTTQAYDMSADGRYVAGMSYDGTSSRAILWTDRQAQSLGILEHFTTSVASTVSDDGSIVTGYCSQLSGPADPNRNQFVWTAAWGMLELHDFLGRHGIEVPSEMYFDRVKVSGDGRTIYGLGAYNEGSYGTFVASVPAPGTVAIVAVLGLVFRRRR